MFGRRSKVENRPAERRRYLRLAAGSSRGTCSAGEITLTDVSPTGLGFETDRCSGFEPGDRQLVIVEDHLGHAFETVAEVRWRVGPSSAGRYRAGLAFVDVLRADPECRWTGIARDPAVEPGEAVAWVADSLAEQPAEPPTPVVQLDEHRRRKRSRSG